MSPTYRKRQERSGSSVSSAQGSCRPAAGSEAGISLLIDCGGWLHRDDFTGQFITTGTSISDGTTLMASILHANAQTRNS